MSTGYLTFSGRAGKRSDGKASEHTPCQCALGAAFPFQTITVTLSGIQGVGDSTYNCIAGIGAQCRRETPAWIPSGTYVLPGRSISPWPYGTGLVGCRFERRNLNPLGLGPGAWISCGNDVDNCILDWHAGVVDRIRVDVTWKVTPSADPFVTVLLTVMSPTSMRGHVTPLFPNSYLFGEDPRIPPAECVTTIIPCDCDYYARRIVYRTLFTWFYNEVGAPTLFPNRANDFPAAPVSCSSSESKAWLNAGGGGVATIQFGP